MKYYITSGTLYVLEPREAIKGADILKYVRTNRKDLFVKPSEVKGLLQLCVHKGLLEVI